MTKRGRIAAVILLTATISWGAARAEAIRLQFRPDIGQKRTMRVTSRLVTNHPAPTGQDGTAHVWTFAVELEPLSLASDGSVTIKVDQATGILLGKEAVMGLKGTAPMPSARPGAFGDPVPITSKATVTVEPVQ